MNKTAQTRQSARKDYEVLFAHVYAHLPANAKLLIEVVGIHDAAVLIEQVGGMSWTFTAGLRRDGIIKYEQLCDIVGVGSANKLTRHLKDTKDFYVPRCTAALAKLRELRIKQEFDSLTARGEAEHSAREAVAKLVQQFKICDRTIWRILKRPDDVVIPSVNRDGELF